MMADTIVMDRRSAKGGTIESSNLARAKIFLSAKFPPFKLSGIFWLIMLLFKVQDAMFPIHFIVWQ